MNMELAVGFSKSKDGFLEVEVHVFFSRTCRTIILSFMVIFLDYVWILVVGFTSEIGMDKLRCPALFILFSSSCFCCKYLFVFF